MSTDEPIWLLDVDGVINAVSARPPDSVWPADSWRTIKANGFPILYSTHVIDFINRVHAEGLAEIHWHTTWEHDAAKLLAPELGLPTFPVADDVSRTAPRKMQDSTWWKLHHATRVVFEQQRRLLWTDDDLHFARWSDEVQQIARRTDDALLVSPNVAYGLSPANLTAIAEWLGLDWRPAAVSS